MDWAALYCEVDDFCKAFESVGWHALTPWEGRGRTPTRLGETRHAIRRIIACHTTAVSGTHPRRRCVQPPRCGLPAFAPRVS